MQKQCRNAGKLKAIKYGQTFYCVFWYPKKEKKIDGYINFLKDSGVIR
jgi:hypothetical protein